MENKVVVISDWLGRFTCNDQFVQLMSYTVKKIAKGEFRLDRKLPDGRYIFNSKTERYLEEWNKSESEAKCDAKIIASEGRWTKNLYQFSKHDSMNGYVIVWRTRQPIPGLWYKGYTKVFIPDDPGLELTVAVHD